MPRYRFGSDTNQQLFVGELLDQEVRHEDDGQAVIVEGMPFWVHDLAESLGGWNEPDPRSTIGVQPFTDLQATSIRSNPPAVARGYEPLEARGIERTFHGGEGVYGNHDRLLGIGRRSTRGQP